MRFKVFFLISIFGLGRLTWGAALPDFSQLNKLGVKFKNPNSFKQVGFQQDFSADRQISSFQFTYKDESLDLTFTGPLSDAQFKNYKRLEFNSIKNIFLGTITPYPGKISKSAQCPARFHPTTQQLEVVNQKVEILFLKASERKTYGVCSDATAFFTASFSILRLKNKMALKIQAYAPLSTPATGLTNLMVELTDSQ